MSFHPEKCEVIHITTKKTPILHSCSLHGHTLTSVPQIKYLGVHINQDLKWNSHINSTSSKANQTPGFANQFKQLKKRPKLIFPPKTRILQCSLGSKICNKSQTWRQNKPQASRPTRNGSEEGSKVGDRMVS